MTKVKVFLALAVFCGGPTGPAVSRSTTDNADSVNPIIEWNKTILTIVRTPGAQPPTIHSTRNFAMLHAAMYDAVNHVAANFSPYLVRLSNASSTASPS